AKAGVAPSGQLVEVRVDDPSVYKVGQKITIGDIFVKGNKADVTGVSKGKGFQGVMKRHNFSGQGASHGTHKAHRAPGSIGACATPSRVFKGMKMAGRMGGDRTTILNLEIVGVDSERSLLLLGGAVPGPNGTIVIIREAVKGGSSG
ncbi:MAG: 50S ribosomal protein L3, partial [Acidimicrobiia bacterium]|nr:50S ribosomal protein L3 [Acidimicrobiia bacterium]